MQYFGQITDYILQNGSPFLSQLLSKNVHYSNITGKGTALYMYN